MYMIDEKAQDLLNQLKNIKVPQVYEKKKI